MKLPQEEYSQLLTFYDQRNRNILPYLEEQALTIHQGFESTSHSLGHLTIDGKVVEVQLLMTSHENDFIDEVEETEE